MVTVRELRTLAAAKGVRGRSKMTKAELEKALGITPTRRRVKSLKPCKAHQYRDPLSNRCRNIPRKRRSRSGKRRSRSGKRRSRSGKRRSRSGKRRSRSRKRRSRSGKRRSKGSRKRKSRVAWRTTYRKPSGSFRGRGYDIETDTGLSISLPREAEDPESYVYRAATCDIGYAMLYLLHKHKNNCIVAPTNVHEMYYYSNQSMAWISKDRYLYVVPGVEQALERCAKRNVRFIVAPLYIVSGGSGHYNYLVYDTSSKSLERFEPHGSETMKRYKPNPMDLAIVDWWSRTLQVNEYYRPSGFCPDNSVQRLQCSDEDHILGERGFCAIWSTWYADLRMSNPDVPREDVLHYSLEVLKRLPCTITNFIRGYAKFVTRHKKKYGTFSEALAVKMCERS